MNETKIPVIQEQVQIGKDTSEESLVKIKKLVSDHTESFNIDLKTENFSIERIAINKELDEPAQVREEGDDLFFPIQEEIVIVKKKILLKEEIKITRNKKTENKTISVKLKKETVEVEREKLN